MAAAVATITAIREEDAVAAMQRTGTMLQEGIKRQADEAGVRIAMTGPPAMPNLRFPDDADLAKGKTFCGTVVDHGVLIHPRHNWFLSAAHSDRDVERALDATSAGFQAVRTRFGDG